MKVSYRTIRTTFKTKTIGESGETWAAGEVGQLQYLDDLPDKPSLLLIFPDKSSGRTPLRNFFHFRLSFAEIQR